MSPKLSYPSWPRTAAVLVWLAVKVALFVLLGRIDTARFVYAGF
jgi:hypothetical protein